MRILIVDDDEIALMMLQEVLVKAGYEAVTARNGTEALERLAKGDCRLVVSDWEMPEMSGVDLCRAIRSDHLRGYVYIILLTGRDTPLERIEGLKAGADDFVGKPYNAAELVARIGSAERVLALETATWRFLPWPN